MGKDHLFERADADTLHTKLVLEVPDVSILCIQ